MENEYIGREIRIAGPDHRGCTNPHIEVIVDGSADCLVYLRTDFNPGRGPPKFEESLDKKVNLEASREDIRAWSGNNPLFENIPRQRADKVALEEAKRRKLVLYRTVHEPRYSTIVAWCPDDWQPHEER